MKDRLGKFFKDIGTFIGKRMGNAFIDVANFVINKALIGSVNKLLGWLNIGKIGTVGMPKKFATGGVVPGYAPGQDKVYSMLSPGEGILRPEAVRALGGQWVDAVNRAAVQGGVGAVQSALGLRKYAAGGVVWPSKTRALSSNYRGHTGIDIRAPHGSGVYAATAGRITSTPRWGYSYGHHIRMQGGGKTQIYAHLSAILTKVGRIVAKGQQIARSGNTGNSTGPHLHFEVRPGGTYGAALAFLRGAGTPSGKAIPSIWDKISSAGIKALANPVGFLKSAVSKFMPKGLPGGIAKVAKAIPNALYDKIFKWIRDKGMKVLGVTGKFFGSAAKKIGDIFGFLGGPGPRPPTLYDRGGYLPPGYSTVLNNTGRPEPVLSPAQWDRIMAGKGGNTYNVHTEVHGADLTADDVAKATVKAIKKAERRR
jgi:murein DD-endopeptidase MepM/ murein hydrolase activator NlpD